MTNTSPPIWDLIVAGAGPAGVALSAAAARSGLSVLCVDPSPVAPWQNNYGSWCRPFAGMGLGHVFARTWTTALVVADETRSVTLDHSYGRIDNALLREALLLDAAPSWAAARVLGVTGEPGAQEVHTAEAGRLRARIVADATGAGGLADVPAGAACQRALGLWLEVDRHPYDLDQVVLMDWRGASREPPSFLYVMPQDRHRIFVEETVLSTREAVDDALLEQRLFARLTALGLVVRHVHGRERCTIPMDLPLPDTAGAVLATGAAGALVHPSSGYMLPRALGAAASVVEALTDAWDQGPAVALAAARRALWPQRARQLHALQTFGLEVLLDLDQAGSQAFFGALGGLDAADWQALMGSDPDRQRVTAAMGRLFLTAPGSVRGALLRPCLRPAGRRQLLRALTPGRS